MANWKANEITSEGKGKLPKIALNDRKAAITQRVLGASRTLPADIVEISNNNLIYSSWFSAFQAEITALIPLFVNHTINSGNFDGLETIPMWTEADILTAIGDATRLPAPTSPLICAAWLNQQRKILNLLRWTKMTLSFSNFIWRDSGLQPSWASAISSFASALWVFNPFPELAYESRTWGAGTYSIRGYDADYKLTTPQIKASFDIYFPELGSGSNFFSFGNMTNVGKLNLVQSTIEQNTGISVTFDKVYKVPIDAGGLPPDPTSQPWINIVTATTGFYPHESIAKFDGANGFTYKDW